MIFLFSQENEMGYKKIFVDKQLLAVPRVLDKQTRIVTYTCYVMIKTSQVWPTQWWFW